SGSSGTATRGSDERALRTRGRGGLERAEVRVPPLDSLTRGLVVEPRIEREFLHVVREPVHGDRFGRLGQRVAGLEIALATTDLADVAPRLGRIHAARVGRPLGDLVAQQ